MKKASGKVSKRESKKGRRFCLSIRSQLILGFLIPVLAVIGVGIFAYGKAEDGMLKNYGESAQTALQMTVKLLDYGFDTVDTDSMQIFNDSNVKNYVSDTYRNDMALKAEALTQAETLIKSKQNSNAFIKDIIIVTADNLNDIATLTGKGDNTGYYDRFMEASRNILDSDDKADRWVGEHAILDERFRTSTDSYICAQYRMVSTKNACVIIDVSTEKIRSILEDLNLGEGSMISFLTWDGRELVLDAGNGFSFADKSYYAAAKAGEESFYSDYVQENGEEYLFMYGRCESNRAAICALIPKSVLMREATAIKNGIVLGVILSCIIVFTVGFGIFMGINSKMQNIMKRLAKVSEGDLTVDVRLNDRAEFGILSGRMMDVVTNTKELIAKVKDTSNQVDEAVGRVKGVGDQLASSNSYVQSITADIAGGVNTQAEDTQNCLSKMDSLSEKIIRAGGSVREMEKLADHTMEMIERSTTEVNCLSGQAQETGRIMDSLTGKMQILNESMENIRVLVSTIDAISEETTLLSLNASIEAARAGGAGKGFAVVAGEIKKLADSSKKSSEQIADVIDHLQVVFEETKEASGKAEDIVKEQELAVEDIRTLFAQMNSNMEVLLKHINGSISDMDEMDAYRKDTLVSFESISAVSEQTAASSESVSDTMEDQSQRVEELLLATGELSGRMKELLSAIEKFVV
ncbi:MAG: methyl-accepting chemotaxis protein [Lachnospiraceae bacterium]